MANRQISYGTRPRRLIEKSRSTINAFFQTGAGTSKTLHVCEDAETLVRAIIQLYCIHELGTISELQMQLAVWPAGVETSVMDGDEHLDEKPALGHIWVERVIKFGEHETHEFKVDLKAMRKLRIGDVVKLRGISDDTDAWKVLGVVTLFFKAG